MNLTPCICPSRNAVRRGVALALVLSGIHSILPESCAANAALENKAPPTPFSVPDRAVDSCPNGTSQFNRKTFMSPDPPPPEAVPQGTIQKGNDSFYLYRNPTRLEQWIMHNARSEKENTGLLMPGKRTPNPGLTRTGDAWRFTRLHRISFRNPFIIGITTLLLFFLTLQSRSGARHHIPLPIPASISAIRRPVFPPRIRFSFFHNKNHAPETKSSWKDPWTPKKCAPKPPVPPDSHLKPESIFTGSIEIIPLDSILQILSNENKTGILFISNENKERVGYFQFCRGEVSEIRSGKLSGEEATCRLLSLKKGFYSLRTIRGCVKTRGDAVNVTSLLLEAHRRMDEESSEFLRASV